MIFLNKHFLVGKDIISLYNLTDVDSIRELEENIFCQPTKSHFIVNYKQLSKEEKLSLNLYVDQHTCMLPFHQMGSLYSFLDQKNSNFVEILKGQPNYKRYFKKWIYQIVNGIYDIHVKKDLYHGLLSDQCIFIDNKLNAQIGFIGAYINDSYDPYNYNFMKYFDDSRKSGKVQKPLMEYLTSEDQNPNKKNCFRNHDIYALGVLLNDIITSTKNEDDVCDQSFEDRVKNDIIELCLKKPDERPNIEKIKTILDQILSLESKDIIDTIDIDVLLQKSPLTKLEQSCYDMARIIAKKLNDQSSLVKYLHTADDPKLINFCLHDNYKFKVYYDSDEESFITEPILINSQGLEINSTKFYTQLKNKMDNPIDCLYFFNNLYFCSLKDLLQIYRPTFTEIHYWLMYLTNVIQDAQSPEDEDKSDSNDIHFPRNFSSETILVSFLNYKNYKKFKDFENSPLKFQLSIFPFDTKETNLSRIYQSTDKKGSTKKDIYSFGVLILEMLHKAIFNKTCFDDQDNENENDAVFTIMDKVIEKLPEDQKFYSNILKGCINREFNSLLDIQIFILLQGRSPIDENDFSDEDMNYSTEKDPSGNLNAYVNSHENMSLKRFQGIFECFFDFPNDNLKEIFMKILCDLNQGFYKREISMQDELYYLNFYEFLEKQKKSHK